MNLLIINDYGIQGGGTETRIRTFVEYLLKEKKVEEIHILQKYPGEKDEQSNAPNLFFHTIEKEQSPYSLARKIIKQHKITLVQAHNLLAIKPFVLFAAKQEGIPVVWWAHDYWLLCAKRSGIDPFHAKTEQMCFTATNKHTHSCLSMGGRIKHKLWKWIINNTVTYAVAPSFVLKQIHEQEGVLQKKWTVIVPWIDSQFLTKKMPKIEKANEIKKNKKQKTVLFVGSLVEFKGAWVAAAALKEIVRSFPNIKLVFVGGDQETTSRYKKDIEVQCKTDGTEKNILFLGKKDKEELLELYQQTDVYLCPTVCMESFGLNWAEAMAAGIPVVASAIGSIPEYIHDNETGILFPPRDAKALAGTVVHLLSLPEQAKKIGNQGRAYAHTNFTLDRAVKELLNIYNNLVKKKE